MTFISLTADSIESEHICCAFSDKKCAASYELKKKWLTQEFDHGYAFKRIDERAKVFIEYGPSESAWIPVLAPNYMMIGCFWVSGKYKKNGHGKTLLNMAIKDAKNLAMDGLATVVGTKKFHFMSDTKWFLKQGFKIRESTSSGFSLLSLDFNEPSTQPRFNKCVLSGTCPEKTGCVVYYSNRCPYSEYHVTHSLVESCKKRNIPLTIIKLKTMKQAQSAPTPATIFSLFLNGKFITTNISTCMDAHFNKNLKDHLIPLNNAPTKQQR